MRQVTGTVMKITVRLMIVSLRQVTNCMACDCESGDKDYDEDNCYVDDSESEACDCEAGDCDLGDRGCEVVDCETGEWEAGDNDCEAGDYEAGPNTCEYSPYCCGDPGWNVEICT